MENVEQRDGVVLALHALRKGVEDVVLERLDRPRIFCFP